MDFDSSNLIVFMFNWKKPLIIIPLVTAILAAVFSGPTFIDPLYESSVIVFPATTNSVSKALLPQQGKQGEDILEFGDETEAEQLLQILNSDQIRDQIIQKYDLMKHYDIDVDGKYPKTLLIDAFNSNISFRRTEFMSVEISVLDTDPDTAMLIANDISKLLDAVKKNIQKQRAQRGIDILADEYARIQKEVDTMKKSLTLIRQKGVLDYESQVPVLNEQLGVALLNKNQSLANQIQAQLDTLAKYGGDFITLRDELTVLKEEEVRLKIALDQAKVDLNVELPSTFTVNEAFPAEKKTYPVRSLLVIISAFASFVFTLVVILVLTSLKGAKK
jgi:uncharacterized protein involved in exopolysaccharide biosynthesis